MHGVQVLTPCATVADLAGRLGLVSPAHVESHGVLRGDSNDVLALTAMLGHAEVSANALNRYLSTAVSARIHAHVLSIVSVCARRRPDTLVPSPELPSTTDAAASVERTTAPAPLHVAPQVA
ncbi:MAG: hypothetical protein ACTJHU_07195 [Mycetocola sp.]